MAQPHSTPTYPSLSRREREILDIIHRLGTPTLSDIIAEMSDPPVRAAVRTLMNIMERKGHVSHGKAGREFVYQATQSRAVEGGSSLRRLLSTFFKGSLTDAIACHFSEAPEELKEGELDEIAELVDRLRTQAPPNPPRRS